MDFDSIDSVPPWRLGEFLDEAILMWRHRDEFLKHLQHNDFLIYSQQYGLAHFATAHHEFDDSRPSSSSPQCSTRTRRIVFRNYLRLTCLLELYNETMPYPALQSAHKRVFEEHHLLFGITSKELSAVWPNASSTVGFNSSDEGEDDKGFSYPVPWRPPGGMRAPSTGRGFTLGGDSDVSTDDEHEEWMAQSIKSKSPQRRAQSSVISASSPRQLRLPRRWRRRRS